VVLCQCLTELLEVTRWEFLRQSDSLYSFVRGFTGYPRPESAPGRHDPLCRSFPGDIQLFLDVAVVALSLPKWWYSNSVGVWQIRKVTGNRNPLNKLNVFD
jgi:hypothetical protein